MKTNPYPYAFFEEKFVKIEDAKISIMTNALQYGNAVFGGIRAYLNADDKAFYIFRLDDHFKRFLSSVNILGCKFKYSSEELKKITINLLKKNKPTSNAYFRPFAFVNHTEMGPSLANETLDFAMHSIPLEEYMPLGKGLSLMVSSWQRFSDNAIPTRAKVSGGYINSSLGRKEANENGYDEAIMLNSRGCVAEGSAENFFIVRDGKLVTPGLSDGILEGITRKSVMQIASDMGINTIERSIERSEIYVADEAFLTGTGCQVAWIEKIDKRTIGSGKIGAITEKLREKFFNVVTGKDKDYSEWRTEVIIK